MAVVVTFVKLLFCIAVGYAANKFKIISQEANKSLSGLVVNITAPALIISSATTVDPSRKTEAIMALVVSFAIYFVIIAAAEVVVRVFKIDKVKRGLYQCSVIFPNSTFMGFPVAQSLLGTEAVFFMSMMNVPYNTLFFSYGLYLLHSGGKFNAKKLINTSLIAAVISMIIFFTGVTVPEVVLTPLSFVGSITTPLSLISIGCTIGTFGLGSVFKDKALYLLTAIRLLVLPVVTWLLLSLTGLSSYLVHIAVLMTAMPVGVVMAMVASEREDLAQTAANIVTLTTLFSMLTIPAISVLTGIITL